MKVKFFLTISFIVLIGVLSFLWFFTLPSRIQKQIANANFCEVDQDCRNINYGVPFGCGDYVNSKQAEKIRSWTIIANLIHPSNALIDFRCAPPPKSAFCRDNKCVPKVCDIGVYYSDFELFADRECDCPSGTVSNITEKGMICNGIEREPILMPK